jgi:hypothetical protein
MSTILKLLVIIHGDGQNFKLVLRGEQNYPIFSVELIHEVRVLFLIRHVCI